MIAVATIILVLAATGFLLRAVVGPSLADRVVAIDGLVVTIVGGILCNSIARDESWFLDLAVVVAFIGFVGTTATARFIERRGG
jgi:multicomponent Na+:H+ antiporter subunit F